MLSCPSASPFLAFSVDRNLVRPDRNLDVDLQVTCLPRLVPHVVSDQIHGLGLHLDRPVGHLGVPHTLAPFPLTPFDDALSLIPQFPSLSLRSIFFPIGDRYPDVEVNG